MNKILDRLRKMPELSHWPDKKLAYTPERSEVLRYIKSDTKLLEAVFRAAAVRGVIEYDKEGAIWRGVPDGLSKPTKPKKPKKEPVRKLTIEQLDQFLSSRGGLLNASNIESAKTHFNCSETTLERRWRDLKASRAKQ